MSRRMCMRVLAVLMGFAASAGLAQQRPTVYTVNYPLQYFAQRIAGDRAQVVLPVPAAVDPAFWRPDAAAIAAFQSADLILLNGAGYAKWLSRVSLPRRTQVNTSAGFSARYLQTQGSVTHSHGPEGAHSHAGTAFTTWLDFSQAAEQAGAVRDALVRLTPEQGEAFEGRFLALRRDLLDLDARLQAVAARHSGRPLIASHPVYQYLARRYSLNLKSVLWEPDAMPAAPQWQAFSILRQGHPADWMVWEGEPAAEIRARLRQLGVASLVFDPCANRPAAGDFLSTMLSNVATMERAFR